MVTNILQNIFLYIFLSCHYKTLDVQNIYMSESEVALTENSQSLKEFLFSIDVKKMTGGLISYFMFRRINKFIQVFNNLKVSKLQNLNFWVKNLFKYCPHWMPGVKSRS